MTQFRDLLAAYVNAESSDEKKAAGDALTTLVDGLAEEREGSVRAAVAMCALYYDGKMSAMKPAELEPIIAYALANPVAARSEGTTDGR